MDRLTVRQTEGQSERLTYIKFEIQTDKQRDSKTKQQNNGLTNRQMKWLAPFSILKFGSV